ncbi:MAG: hypothetical protein AAF570_15885 [Bacteroidota bacterium]
MKTRINLNRHLHHLAFLLVLIALISMGTSCSDTRAESATTPETPAQTVENTAENQEVPRLLARHKALGSVDEQVKVASAYDGYVARIRQNSADADAYLRLASLFMNEARITGEHPYYYPAALKMLDAIPAT